MSAAAWIQMLDSEIDDNGQDISLVLVAPSSKTTVPCRAFVRQYRPQELIGGILQGDTLVVLSPTDLAALSRLPRRNDQVTVDGAIKRVEYVEPVKLDNQLVRVNLQVRGP
jgi:hypothetical protein